MQKKLFVVLHKVCEEKIVGFVQIAKHRPNRWCAGGSKKGRHSATVPLGELSVVDFTIHHIGY